MVLKLIESVSFKSINNWHKHEQQILPSFKKIILPESQVSQEKDVCNVSQNNYPECQMRKTEDISSQVYYLFQGQ